MIAQWLGLPFPLGMDLLNSLPFTAGNFILGLIVLGWISASGFVLARLGYKPLWALALAIPYAQLVAPWVLAYIKWPRKGLA